MAKKKPKETGKVALSLRLPENLYNRIKDRAEAQKRSINMQAQMLIEIGFDYQ